MNRIEIDDSRDYLIWREGSGGSVEIFDIVVGSCRRRGNGRRLVDELLRRIPDHVHLVWAITRADNFIAQLFYEALRFRVVAPLRNFYGVKNADGRDTVDAILYARDIGSQA